MSLIYKGATLMVFFGFKVTKRHSKTVTKVVFDQIFPKIKAVEVFLNFCLCVILSQWNCMKTNRIIKLYNVNQD